MINKLIDLGFRFSGLNWLWGALDGYKSKIAAVAAILSGLAGIIQGFLGASDAHSLSAVLEFLKALPKDQSFLTLIGGLGVLGISHKIDKQVEPVKQ